jgi:hypothetical protein
MSKRRRDASGAREAATRFEGKRDGYVCLQLGVEAMGLPISSELCSSLDVDRVDKSKDMHNSPVPDRARTAQVTTANVREARRRLASEPSSKVHHGDR